MWPRSKKATGLSPSWELPHVLHVTVWVLFGCWRRKTFTRLVGNFQFTVSVTDCLFICVVLWWTGKGVNQPLPLDSWHGLSRPRICWTFWGNSALDSTLLTSAAGFRIYCLYSVFYLYYSLRISVWKCANSFHFDKVLPLLPPPPRQAFFTRLQESSAQEFQCASTICCRTNGNYKSWILKKQFYKNWITFQKRRERTPSKNCYYEYKILAGESKANLFFFILEEKSYYTTFIL